MTTRILPGWPHFAEDERAAVEQVLTSGRVNYWTGDEGRAFEREFAAYVGVPYAIALANGTVALEAAVLGLGLQPGDDVLVTPRTFIASASAAVVHGLRPVFADIDPDSQNVTAETLARALTDKTRAIVAVHLAGWPCDMEPILAFAAAHDLWVIEDCAQAHGARYRGQVVGSFGHAAAFSFCQDKIMTTGGEGGMVVCRDAELWARIWAYKDHGKSFDRVYRTEHPQGFRWLHDTFGTNWRLTEMQSAIGRIQLAKLDGWLAMRRSNAAVLVNCLSDFGGLRVPLPPADIGHAYYKFYAFVVPEKLRAGWNRDRIMTEIVALGVPCFSGSCGEIYRERAFRDAGLAPPAPLPVAAELAETSLMFLVHPTLTALDMAHYASRIRTVMERASL